jgi:hypothetical protein
MNAGNGIQVDSSGRIKVKSNGIVVAGASDPCCCGMLKMVPCCVGGMTGLGLRSADAPVGATAGSTVLYPATGGACYTLAASMTGLTPTSSAATLMANGCTSSGCPSETGGCPGRSLLTVSSVTVVIAGITIGCGTYDPNSCSNSNPNGTYTLPIVSGNGAMDVAYEYAYHGTGCTGSQYVSTKTLQLQVGNVSGPTRAYCSLAGSFTTVFDATVYPKCDGDWCLPLTFNNLLTSPHEGTQQPGYGGTITLT